jgi:hypothetical protein
VDVTWDAAISLSLLVFGLACIAASVLVFWGLM